MAKEKRFCELLVQIIENPYDWGNFFKDFSYFFKIDAIFFQKIFKNNCSTQILFSYNLDPKFLKNYENLIKKDITVLNYLRNLEEYKIFDDVNFFTPLKNFLQQNDFNYTAIISILNNLKENIIFASLKQKGNNKFTVAEKANLLKLSNLIKLAYTYCTKVERMENNIELLKKTLEYEGKGIIILDDNYKILLLNKIAEKILAQKDGIEITKDGFEVTDPVVSVQFKKNLKKFFSANNLSQTDYVFAIPRADEGIPIILQMMPYQENFILNENSKKVIIVIYDPKFRPLPNSSFLSQAFQFTQQEKNVAILLARGLDLKEISQELKISLHTVRTHLKHIYTKTNTSRQAELIKLLLGLPQSI